MAKFALISCPTCTKEIARSAKTCPHCGAKAKKRRGWLSAIARVIVILLGIGLLLNGLSKLSDNHGGTNSATTKLAVNKIAPGNDTTTDVGQLAEQIYAAAETRLPQCGTADAQAMATSAIEDSPNNPPNIKVLDFKDFNPNAPGLSPEILQAILNVEGVSSLSLGNDKEVHLSIKNTSTERHCFATVFTNAGEEAIRYRFFLSSKNQPLVEVLPLSP